MNNNNDNNNNNDDDDDVFPITLWSRQCPLEIRSHQVK